ncbi:Pre-mRNA splicing factor RNA helicase [Spironucleus salmonicida]|uniref:Pre-mRNA splicing factor RNA helicase n=1 Tax=Spironucleus salmonicida TaxID=348837 RepID=V6LL40_9EUKA|nr:Pre-mRNA splicing factor RNA helicase [Spironucleus salmonicida]|eukprot:EST45267.1 Pre-mRNA splicing factor RNA helicase [Spironucleus salmonicida]
MNEEPTQKIERPKLQLKFRPSQKIPLNKIELNQDFPLSQQENTIANFLSSNQQILFIRAETGSGKSTILPQIIFKYFNQKVVIIQPRRLAAVSLANFLNCDYMVRFDQRIKNTNYIFITDGMFLRCATQFSEYWVIVDEAHERTAAQDLIRGYLITKNIKTIITSASQQTQENELCVSGKMYPVQVVYNQSSQQFTQFVIQTSQQIIVKLSVEEKYQQEFQHYSQQKGYQINNMKLDINKYIGDILIFMPGQNEIYNILQQLKKLDIFLDNFYTTINLKRKIQFNFFPLHGQLSIQKQNEIFVQNYQENVINVIISTNIAETSITIQNITIVIDSAMQKTLYYDNQKHSNTLIIETISKSSFQQRKGRAGRVRPGIFFSQLSQENYKNLKSHTTPEISRIRLEQTICDLILLLSNNSLSEIYIQTIISYPFPDPPDSQKLLMAIETLSRLKFITHDNNYLKLTQFGHHCLQISLGPELAFFVTICSTFQDEALKIASFMASGDIFIPNDGFQDDFQQILWQQQSSLQKKIFLQLKNQTKFYDMFEPPTVNAAFAAATQHVAYFNGLENKFFKQREQDPLTIGKSSVRNAQKVTFSIILGQKMYIVSHLTDEDIKFAEKFK